MVAGSSTRMPPVGKSGPFTNFSSVRSWMLGFSISAIGRGAQFAQIVRRDRGRHADRDAVRAVGQQIGEGGRQHDRLFVLAVIGGAEIDRVLVQPFQQRLGDLGQAAFGVAHGGGVIAVDIAEIALAFDQRIAHARNPGPGAPARHRSPGRHGDDTCRSRRRPRGRIS